jgi:hypothetical protein
MSATLGLSPIGFDRFVAGLRIACRLQFDRAEA